jgi:hypothetical protein
MDVTYFVPGCVNLFSVFTSLKPVQMNADAVSWQFILLKSILLISNKIVCQIDPQHKIPGFSVGQCAYGQLLTVLCKTLFSALPVAFLAQTPAALSFNHYPDAQPGKQT